MGLKPKPGLSQKRSRDRGEIVLTWESQIGVRGAGLPLNRWERKQLRFARPSADPYCPLRDPLPTPAPIFPVAALIGPTLFLQHQTTLT